MSDHTFDLMLRGCARDLVRLRPEERLRIDRGLVLALNRVTDYVGGSWHVQSASDPEVIYVVGAQGCDCPDQRKAPDGRCKHYWSVYLTQAAQQQETPHVEDL
jgi:hypothetical protein